MPVKPHLIPQFFFFLLKIPSSYHLTESILF